MAITFIGSGNGAGDGDSSASFTVDYSGLEQAGDVVVIIVGKVSGTSTITCSDNGGAFNFTPFGGTNSNGNSHIRGFFGVYAGSGESATVSANLATHECGSGDSLTFRGVDQVDTEDVDQVTNTGGGTNPDCAATTPATNNACIIAAAMSDNGDATPGTITNYSAPEVALSSSTGTEVTTAVSYRILVGGSGSPENPGAYPSWITGTWASLTLALREFVEPPEPPPTSKDWPNPPRRRRGLVQDWTETGNALTAEAAPSTDIIVLRNPYKGSIRLPIPPVDTQPLGSPLAVLAPPPEVPHNQYDWPNPRGPQRGRQDWQDSFKLPLQGTLPLNQYDWPLPRGPRRNPQDWNDSFKLPLQEVLPPSQHDWPNPPLAARRLRPDFQLSILPLIEPVVLFPVSTPREWPNPRGPRRHPQDWQDGFKLPLQTIVPLNQYDWPNPQRGPKRNLQDLLASSMFIPEPAPAPEPAQHALMGQIWME